jgi:putative aldouronate transport system substrate-binding protein
MKRIIAVLWVLLVVSAAVFATGNTEAADGERVTIRTNIHTANIPEEYGTMTDNRIIDYINEFSPVDVEYQVISYNDFPSVMDVQFAAGDAPDYIFSYRTSWLREKYVEGLTYPLTDLIEEHAPNIMDFYDEYPVARDLATMDDGEIHLISYALPMGPNWALLVREDWLENLGLDVPTTAEELFDVAYAFTYEDPDGNGEDDTFGINLSWIGSLMVDIMFGRTDDNFYPQDGSYVFDLERLVASTEFKRSLYAEGLVDRDFLADNNGSKARQDFVTGKLGLYFANQGVRDASLYEAFYANHSDVPEARIMPIAFPETEFGAYNPIHDSQLTMRNMVNARTDHPVEAVQLANFFFDLDHYVPMHYGEEGVDFEYDEEGVPTFLVDSATQQAKFAWGVHWRNHFPQALIPEAWISPERTYLGRGEIFERLYEAYVAGEEIYIDPDKPYAWTPVFGDTLPPIPAEFSLVGNAKSDMLDAFSRAIVGGDDYTVPDALEAAQVVWESSGGPDLEAFYASWFDENEGSVIYWSDFYQD